LLNGKRILITGANGGIGLAVAEDALKNNAKVVLLYHKNREYIDELLTRNTNLKSNAEIHQIDLIDTASLEKKLLQILKNGNIDVFIHSVSLPIENKGILERDWNDFQSHLEIQTKSFFQIIKHVVPFMKEKKQGKIIAILTSYVVGKPPNKISDYIVGKYSLLGLIKSLAVELGPFGITVNSISPSMTQTHLIKKLPNKLKEITATQIPLGRLAEPTDVSSTVLFLCSENANYISGENILLTGGGHMH